MPVRISEQEIGKAAQRVDLAVVGAFAPGPEDGAPAHVRTLVLLGPSGAGMWREFSASDEYSDGAPDPLDRWSRRVISDLADELGAEALFPFGGPPYQPFIRWASRAEPAFASPVGMQVSRTRGLWGSYRGALGFRAAVGITPRTTDSPCLECPAPCLSACPVDAFVGGRYDVPACVSHLDTPEGTGCMDGCLVRAACPFGARHAPPPEQLNFHMRAFLANQLRKQAGG